MSERLHNIILELERRIAPGGYFQVNRSGGTWSAHVLPLHEPLGCAERYLTGSHRSMIAALAALAMLLREVQEHPDEVNDYRNSDDPDTVRACQVQRNSDGAPCTRPVGHSGAHIHESNEPDGNR